MLEYLIMETKYCGRATVPVNSMLAL